jgi:hypothetical protein
VTSPQATSLAANSLLDNTPLEGVNNLKMCVFFSLLLMFLHAINPCFAASCPRTSFSGTALPRPTERYAFCVCVCGCVQMCFIWYRNPQAQLLAMPPPPALPAQQLDDFIECVCFFIEFHHTLTRI